MVFQLLFYIDLFVLLILMKLNFVHLNLENYIYKNVNNSNEYPLDNHKSFDLDRSLSNFYVFLE